MSFEEKLRAYTQYNNFKLGSIIENLLQLDNIELPNDYREEGGQMADSHFSKYLASSILLAANIASKRISQTLKMDGNSWLQEQNLPSTSRNPQVDMA